jgi:hypothetical protein
VADQELKLRLSVELSWMQRDVEGELAAGRCVEELAAGRCNYCLSLRKKGSDTLVGLIPLFPYFIPQ